MYQSIIRDPGGDGLIRVQPELCSSASSVVNGSILLVPPGTVAFVAVNGQLSPAYGPGRHTIFTGVHPFFVRLRNILKHGDPGISVSVFFLSPQRSCLIRLGTGEFPFRERRFQLTMKALASCGLAFSIGDPQKVLQKLVGSYRSDFSPEDLQPCLEQLVLTPVREALSQQIRAWEVADFNSHLTQMGNAAQERIRSGLSEYGIQLDRFELLAIHVPDAEMQRLYRLEQEYADGKNRTDLELDHLQRIWKGKLEQRTFSEMLTGIPSRGQASSAGNTSGGGGGEASVLMHTMLLAQMLPSLGKPLAEMAQRGDLFGGTPPHPAENASTQGTPPPMPGRYKRCPSCRGNVLRSQDVCPVCGYRFPGRNGGG